MSLAADLYYVMNNDASLSASISGGIYYENLPDNFDLAKKWLLYYFRKDEQIDCLGQKAVYFTNDLSCILIAQNTEDLTNLTDDIITYLNGAEYGSILDINFVNDGHSFDKEKNIYMNEIVFTITNV